jgi:hypothetical protein
MSCSHLNPAGYVFCGTCGDALKKVRCSCGWVVGIGDFFCGNCGKILLETPPVDGKTAVDNNHRFDLESLARQAAQEKQFLETTHKARVTQDDIRKLLTLRRKKF